ncbi:MAG: YjiH family protein, partial [Sedimentibacter saalensis]
MEYDVNNLNKKSIMKFAIPSALGVFIFLFPLPWNGSVNIPIGILSEWLAALIAPVAPTLITVFILISAIMTAITSLLKPKAILDNKLLSKLFTSSPFYLFFKIIGAVVVLMVYFNVGPEYVISGDTGGTMLSLLKTLVAWFFAASFLIPLLMDFGIMDYTGTLVRNFTQPLFKLPGRSAIDLLASWVGNCNVGVVLTTTQY